MRASLIALRLAGVLVLAGIAHGPLFGAAYRAQDLELLARAEAPLALAPADPATDPAADHNGAVERGSPLGNAWHAAHARLEPAQPRARPSLLACAEPLFLLLVAAGGLGLFLRRLLQPWTGAEHAAAAGWAALLLLPVHPLAPSLAAPLAARDELLALALSSVCAALFLLGRQERRPLATAAAWCFCAAAALAHELAWLLGPALAAVELASAHRYRGRRERLRTALNTLFFFSAASALGAALWAGRAGARGWSGLALFADRPLAALAELVGRLGGLFLPANPDATGLGATVLAGAVFLAALQPGLIAARSAPRLWSWLVGAWFAALLATLALGLDARVGPSEPNSAALLTGAVAVAAAGLATSSTALSGLRRAFLPWITAAAWAGLACANALPWREAGEVAAELASDLEAARARYGESARLLVLDVPRRVHGVDPFGPSGARGGFLTSDTRSSGAEVHANDALPAAPQAGTDGEPTGAARVVLLSTSAFLMLADEPELARLREERAVVLVPASALAAAESAPLRAGGTRAAVQLRPATAAGSARSWQNEMRSPDFDLDALSISSVVLGADLRSDTSGERRIAWRATEPGFESGSLRCVWVETGDEPLLACDVGRSLAWQLGGRIRRVWLEGGATSIKLGRLLEAPEPLAADLEPAADGADWVFPAPRSALVDATRQRGRYTLALLSLGDYEHVEIPVEADGPERLRAAGAADRVAALARPVAWALDYRVEDVTLARARGRRVGHRGTVEER